MLRIGLPWIVATAAWVGLFHFCIAAEPTSSTLLIEKWVRDLNADQFKVRQHAEAVLLGLGSPSLPALERAAVHGSPEVRTRVERIALAIRHRTLAGEFQRLARIPDEDLEIEDAMCVISQILNPACKREELTLQLESLAALVKQRLKTEPARTDPQVCLETLRQVLFVEHGFQGNQADYENPENSSLERVLTTRKGLPITLAYIVIGVGQRLHLPLEGVAVSGPYLVKYDGQRAPPDFPRTDLYMHPFEGGRLLAPKETAAQLEGYDLDRLAMLGSHRYTVRRMLTNLAVHLSAKGRSAEAALVDGYRQLFDDGLNDGLDP